MAMSRNQWSLSTQSILNSSLPYSELRGGHEFFNDNILKKGLISDHLFYYLEICLNGAIAGLISIFGIFANIVNIFVFAKQGLKDMSTISLFLLSISDLGVVLFTLYPSVLLLFFLIGPDYNIDRGALHYVTAAFPRSFFFHISMWTTTYMSVERCLCVIRPLTFKRLLTRRRALCILAVFYTEVSVNFVINILENKLQWKTDLSANSTSLKLYTKPLMASLGGIINLVDKLFFSTTAVVLLLASSAVMLAATRSSSQFRKSVSSSTDEKSSKRSRLVKVVVGLSIMFLLCNLPVMLARYAKQFVDELRPHGRYNNLNQTLYALIYVSNAINASANIFVYLSISTRYQEIFRIIFAGRDSRSQTTS